MEPGECAATGRGEQVGSPAAQLDKVAADRVARAVGFLLGDICNMDDRLAPQQTSMRVIRADCNAGLALETP
jgi:hypothetical protein